MSLLQYLQSTDRLPNPRWMSSTILPSRAIAQTNAEVKKKILHENPQKEDLTTCIYRPETRAAIGKYASVNRLSAAWTDNPES